MPVATSPECKHKLGAQKILLPCVKCQAHTRQPPPGNCLLNHSIILLIYIENFDLPRRLLFLDLYSMVPALFIQASNTCSVECMQHLCTRLKDSLRSRHLERTFSLASLHSQLIVHLRAVNVLDSHDDFCCCRSRVELAQLSNGNLCDRTNRNY